MPRGAAMPLLPLNAFFVFLCHIFVDASVGQRWSCLIHHVSLTAERNNVGTLVSITEVAFERVACLVELLRPFCVSAAVVSS